MAAYNFITQNIISSCLIENYSIDSFYNPGPPNNHTGFAVDGNYYSNGVLSGSPPIPSPPTSPPTLTASWFNEFTLSPNPYRGGQAAFPSAGLVLLSPVSLVILDTSIPVTTAQGLPLWMQFLWADDFGFSNNYNGGLNGWTPTAVTYADGVISVTCIPDAGNSGSYPNASSNRIIALDFSQDTVYADVAI